MRRREERGAAGTPGMPVNEDGEPAFAVGLPQSEPPRFCGSLALLGGKGPLRAFRSRWFVFQPRRCSLHYYKSPAEGQALGSIDISEASFGLSPEEEEGLFHIRSRGRDWLLKAPNRQVMAYWLQELQQKRWEYSNNLGVGKGDRVSSPTPLDVSKGLVAKDNPDYFSVLPNNPAEKARNILTVETDPGELVGDQAASQSSSAQFSLKQFGADIRNSMISLKQSKGNQENRKSLFYTNEEWEMLDPSPKEMEESIVQEERRKSSFEGSKGSGSIFNFGHIPNRGMRPFRDLIGVNKNRNSIESSPAEWNSSSENKTFEIEQKLESHQEENENLRKELSNQKELVRLLQQTVRSSQYDKYLASPLCDAVPKDKMELLHQKDYQILGLNNLLEKQNLEKDSIQQEVKNLQSKIGELNEQLNMLMETIQAKDEVIMKLSRQLSECENTVPSQSVTEAAIPPSMPWDQQELDRLMDSLQGYKTQNKFLNKEILELAALRKNAEIREREMQTKYHSLEARLCQIESKYLVLLQEVKTPVCSEGQGPSREVITQLLEDALKVETEQPEHTYFRHHTVSEYDLYGFQTVPEDDEEERLVAKVRALDLKNLSLTESQDASTGVKWENYLASIVNREMVRSPELKNLIRYGIPHAHRSKMWAWCVNSHIKKMKDNTAPGYFQNLLKNALEKQNPASKQIELDLMRTLPNNKHYSSPTSEGIQKLRNILLAFSWRNPDIGYCQGLNRLAAIALLYLEQEDAFWCLVTIVEVFMPRDYYTKTLLGSQVDQRVFKDLMNEKLPRLHAHLEQYKVDSSLITFNWFLVVFADSVVSDVFIKIWDSFLYEGSKVIFRFALALFKYKEEEILKLQDSMSIFKYLRYFTRTILDARKLINIAFVDMNPFPLRQIRNRRAYHLEKVRLELTELETIRNDFLRERDSNPERMDLISDDEEDS